MDGLDEILRQTIAQLRSLTDVNTVIGKPIITEDGTVILPVSKVSMGFVSGGGEYSDTQPKRGGEYPHAVVSGGGVTVMPVGFLVCGKEKKFLSLENPPENKWTELAKNLIRTLKKDDND